VESHARMSVIFDAVIQSAFVLGPPVIITPTNASKPWGACITELGCSSSSDLGLNASFAALTVSNYSLREHIAFFRVGAASVPSAAPQRSLGVEV